MGVCVCTKFQHWKTAQELFSVNRVLNDSLKHASTTVVNIFLAPLPVDPDFLNNHGKVLQVIKNPNQSGHLPFENDSHPLEQKQKSTQLDN